MTDEQVNETPDLAPETDEPQESSPAQDEQPDSSPEITEDAESEPVEQPAEEPKVPIARFNKVFAQKQELKQELDQLKATQKPVVKTAPTLEAFDYDEEKHQAAVVEFNTQEAVAAEMAKIADRQKQETAINAKNAQINEYTGKYQEYSKENPKFAALTQQYQNMVFPDVIQSALFEAESGVGLHHHLLENPALIAEIDSMSEREADKFLARLDTKLAVKPKVSKSKAPPPIAPVKGNVDGVLDPLKAAQTMTPEQYYKYRTG